MIERSGTSDSPKRLMVKAAADALRDWGYTRDDTLDNLSQRATEFAIESAVRADTGHTWEEFATEALAAPGMKEKLALCIGGDYILFGQALSSRVREQAEYIIAEALQTLSSRDEIERDRHVDQQIKQAKETA